MGKHTTIEQDKASMTRYRVTFEEFEGDGLAYVDFTDLHEAGDFIIPLHLYRLRERRLHRVGGDALMRRVAFAAASLIAMVAVSELIRLMCWAVLAIGCPLHGMDVPPLFW